MKLNIDRFTTESDALYALVSKYWDREAKSKSTATAAMTQSKGNDKNGNSIESHTLWLPKKPFTAVPVRSDCYSSCDATKLNLKRQSSGKSTIKTMN